MTVDDLEEALGVLAGCCISAGIDRTKLINAFREAAKEYQNTKSVDKEIVLLKIGVYLKDSFKNES